MKDVRFFHCNACGNVVALLVEGGGELVCCGQPMEELKAGTTDAAVEKHVPYITKADGKIEVQVGEVEHPMLEEHYICFIAAVYGNKIKIERLAAGDAPKAVFCDPGCPVTIYEFCNLHGLWKAEA